LFFNHQIGNAVPSPMGRAIGLEIKKCLVWKQANDESNIINASKDEVKINENDDATSSLDRKSAKERNINDKKKKKE
jgi:hypothetical protein